MIVRYHLKDEGQDLCFVDIEGDRIVDAGSKTVIGKISYDYYADKTLKKGGKIRYSAGPDYAVYTIKYPIVRVEYILDADDLPPLVEVDMVYAINGQPYVCHEACKEDKEGRWVDVSTGRVFDNQMSKDCAIGAWRDSFNGDKRLKYMREAAKLKLGWWNAIKGRLEVP